MRRLLLLLGTLMLSITSTNAAEAIVNAETKSNSRYNYARPVQFTERGISFFVFQNGEFDFNTHPRHYNRRSGYNNTYGAVNKRPGAVRVEYDYHGRVRRIGNVFINYDRLGRVKRIGRVYMRYRHNRLVRVGNLRLIYNRYGRLIRMTGRVRPGNFNNGNWSDQNGFDPGFGQGGNDWNDDWNDDWSDQDDWDDDDGGVLYLRSQDEKKERKKEK